MTVETKTIEELKEALSDAEKDLRHFLNCSIILRADSHRATCANLCEAYLDEWYTLGILEKNPSRG